ncbi:MAG: hypothetical protein MZV49_25095 [Rhodopseudomonas palustris]|nr:hypothetical protein [Rhodopseudomonas palustris]
MKSDGNIRFVLKEYPILGKKSVLASRFAIAVLQIAGPEAYKQAHDRLIDFRGDMTTEALGRLARTRAGRGGDPGRAGLRR